MINFKLLLVGMFTASACIAQSINISGKVTDTSGTPLPDAIVKLLNTGLTVTTDVDGSFSFSTASIRDQNDLSKQHLRVASISNGLLYVNLPSASVIEIKTYTL